MALLLALSLNFFFYTALFIAAGYGSSMLYAKLFSLPFFLFLSLCSSSSFVVKTQFIMLYHYIMLSAQQAADIWDDMLMFTNVSLSTVESHFLTSAASLLLSSTQCNDMRGER